MYNKGDKVFFGDSGVSIIENITEMQSPDTKQIKKYYEIRPLFQSIKVFIPVDDKKSFIRPLITKQEAKDLTEHINKLEIYSFQGISIKDKASYYNSLIKSRKCSDLLKLIISVYIKKSENENTSRQSITDERYCSKAEILLYGELSVVLGLSFKETSMLMKTKIDHYIEERKDSDIQGK